jgi:hypothetical protein
LAKQRQWTLSQVGSAVDQFCLELVRIANYLLSDGLLEWVDRVFGMSVRPGVRRANRELRRMAASVRRITADCTSPQCASWIENRGRSTLRWEDIELRFLSEERVQIFMRGTPASSVSFTDLGLDLGVSQPLQM